MVFLYHSYHLSILGFQGMFLHVQKTHKILSYCQLALVPGALRWSVEEIALVFFVLLSLGSPQEVLFEPSDFP